MRAEAESKKGQQSTESLLPERSIVTPIGDRSSMEERNWSIDEERSVQMRDEKSIVVTRSEAEMGHVARDQEIVQARTETSGTQVGMISSSRSRRSR